MLIAVHVPLIWLFVEEGIRLFQVHMIFVNQKLHIFSVHRFVALNLHWFIYLLLFFSIWLVVPELFSSVFRHLTGAAAGLCGIVGSGPRSQ